MPAAWPWPAITASTCGTSLTATFRTFVDPDGIFPVEVAYAPDGKTLAEGNGKGDIHLLDLATGHWLTALYRETAVYQSTSTPNQENLDQVVISPTGQTLVAADDLGNVYVWNLSGGAPVVVTGAATTSHASGAKVAFSPDGKTLAIAGEHGVLLWDVAAHAVTATLTGPGTSPEAVAFAPDGKTLAAGDRNGDIYLWNLATRQAVTVKGSVTDWGGLRFSPDGRTLAACPFLESKLYLYSVRYTS